MSRLRLSPTIILGLLALGACSTGQTGPLWDQFESLCDTEAGFKTYQPPVTLSSILFKGNIVNRAGTDPSSYVLDESGCTLTCQYWLRERVFDFLEAEVDFSRPATHRFFVPYDSRRAASNLGRSTIYLRYSFANSDDPSCKWVNPTNYQKCLNVDLIDAPSSKFYVKSKQDILGKVGDFLLLRFSTELREVEGDALAARSNYYIYEQQNTGFGRNSKKCPAQTRPFPMEFLNSSPK